MSSVDGKETPELWYDAAAGPVVRPYAITRGRAQPAPGGLDMISLVVTRAAAGPLPAELSPEQALIVERCTRPLSVAEIAAELDLPLGTVRVLLGDLLEARLIETYEPLVLDDSVGEDMLEAVLAGLRLL
ncbi:DUF742 domain-containing protein [Micromonospora polyrhachis]|uniref:DUF742 domain-containing protein n=1 Tax=Micromonospora polyrhachis TaxID=1282883 RepID=A0A7W7SPR2_9ACTN|nr:hypothetical protein [Micromonospora polyrhachis]